MGTEQPIQIVVARQKCSKIVFRNTSRMTTVAIVVCTYAMQFAEATNARHIRISPNNYRKYKSAGFAIAAFSRSSSEEVDAGDAEDVEDASLLSSRVVSSFF